MSRWRPSIDEERWLTLYSRYPGLRGRAGEDGGRMATLLEILYATGLRVSEATTLRVADIDSALEVENAKSLKKDVEGLMSSLVDEEVRYRGGYNEAKRRGDKLPNLVETAIQKCLLGEARSLLLDADIELAAHTVPTLLSEARSRGTSLVSIMAELSCTTFWERLLTPAFVFFFKLLQFVVGSRAPGPPAEIRRDSRRVRAAGRRSERLRSAHRQ